MATWDVDIRGVELLPVENMASVPAHGGYFDLDATGEMLSTPWVAGGSVIMYTMRGFDQNGGVNDYVTWSSLEVDADASDYSGSAGPVVDVVLLGTSA